MSENAISPLAADRLRGAKAIADYIGEDVRRVQHLIKRNLLPVSREARHIVASKKRLDEWWESKTRGDRVDGRRRLSN